VHRVAESTRETAWALPLRRGQAADAEALARFAARTFAETFGPDNRPEDIAAHLANSYGSAQQGRELADPDYITLLVEGSDGIAGYAQLRRGNPPPCVATGAPVELYRFYVDRGWQGTGLAQRLMEAVQAAAAAWGGRSIWLSVWERNPRAIAFYVKSGYRDVGTADFYVGPDRQTDRVLVTGIIDKTR
jgi:ribosomal protein S18 acetylase RimI-like enzyme